MSVMVMLVVMVMRWLRKCRACGQQEHPRDHEGSGYFVHKNPDED